MAKQYFYIARFDGKHARIPKGYEVRFTSTKLIPNLDQLNRATSNKFYNEVTEAAISQGMDRAFNIDRNVIKGLATEGHFFIDAPALREEYEKKEKDKEGRKSASKQPSSKNSSTRVAQSSPVRRVSKASRQSSSSTSGGSCLFAIISTIFYLLKRLFFSPWKWAEGTSTFGKIWHIVKVVFRIVMICLVIVLVLVLFIIISSAIKESK